MWKLERGATVQGDGQVHFAVWAPHAQRVEVQLQGDAPRVQALARDDHGVFSGALVARPGDDYRYLLDGARACPDPCSRWQPQGVHGPSRVVDPDAFGWHDQGWRGRPLADYLLYELHVGTFTREGSFDAVIPRLDHLVALGVTAVELMPVAEFPGVRNWGYDGVHLYAPQSSYGGPEGLRRLVDACHDRGLAVVLDVVYNHLGPEGNALGAFGPYFTDRYRTAWGPALNYDGPDSDPVRAHVVDNARCWFHEFHVDALRLDAIHGIFDCGARPILAELAQAAQAASVELGRPCLLIAESDLNDARVLRPQAQGGLGLDAQWSDDFHHALYALLGDDRRGVFADFGQAAQLGRALTQGYVFQGEPSRHRRRRHGNPSGDRPGAQFVVFVQNHDRVANACQGQRLVEVVGWQRARLAATVLLCAPNLPLLFMGEEWGARAPFDYFVSHGDAALIEAVRQGRQREHAAYARGQPFRDPQDPATCDACRLDWDERERTPHRQHLALYRALIALRRRHPALRNLRMDQARATWSEAPPWLCLRRSDPGGTQALLVASFGAQPCRVEVPAEAAQLRCALDSEDPAWGGSGRRADDVPAAGAAIELPTAGARLYLS